MLSTLVPVFFAMILLMFLTLSIENVLVASLLYFVIAYVFVLYFDIPLNPFMSQARLLTGAMERRLFMAILATQLIAVFLTVSLYRHVSA